MYSIKNNIQALDLNIKVMDIDHFNEHSNSLTTALSAHCMIMLYLMHHRFKSYKVYEDSNFRYFLK